MFLWKITDIFFCFFLHFGQASFKAQSHQEVMVLIHSIMCGSGNESIIYYLTNAQFKRSGRLNKAANLTVRELACC